MATITKKSQQEALAEFESPQTEDIANAEIVRGRRDASNPPVSVRLSAPLLERLDILANQENRKRGNLIQHILWEYVRAHGIE